VKLVVVDSTVVFTPSAQEIHDALRSALDDSVECTRAFSTIHKRMYSMLADEMPVDPVLDVDAGAPQSTGVDGELKSARDRIRTVTDALMLSPNSMKSRYAAYSGAMAIGTEQFVEELKSCNENHEQ
jgi:hypothetical protein